MGSLHRYLMWNFWIGVVGVIARAIIISYAKYPRTTTTTSRLSDVLVLFISLWFTVWAYILLG